MADGDRVKGKAKEAAGKLEKNAGKAVGDKDIEAEGAGREMEGKVQNKWGNAKDLAADAADAVGGKSKE
jgi:uncharacterized protein YjbJ (UPF0337 family)